MKSNPDLQNDLLNAAQISRLDASLAALLRRVGRTKCKLLGSKSPGPVAALGSQAAE